jgi:hypothetical protein
VPLGEVDLDTLYRRLYGPNTSSDTHHTPTTPAAAAPGATPPATKDAGRRRGDQGAGAGVTAAGVSGVSGDTMYGEAFRRYDRDGSGAIELPELQVRGG